MIKPLLVSTYDPKAGAGAARAAYRLHQGLHQQGINSQMLVQEKRMEDSTIIGSASLVARARGYLLGYFKYNSDLLDSKTVAQISGHFDNLLAVIAANPEQPVAQFTLLS